MGLYSYIEHLLFTSIPQPPSGFLNKTTVGPSLGLEGFNKLKGYLPDATSSGVRNGDNNLQHITHESQGTSEIGSSVEIDVRLMFIELTILLTTDEKYLC